MFHRDYREKYSAALIELISVAWGEKKKLIAPQKLKIVVIPAI